MRSTRLDETNGEPGSLSDNRGLRGARPLSAGCSPFAALSEALVMEVEMLAQAQKNVSGADRGRSLLNREPRLFRSSPTKQVRPRERTLPAAAPARSRRCSIRNWV